MSKGGIAVRAVAAIICVGLLATVVAQDVVPIRPAPDFTATQLLARPTSSWITSGGTLYNQRYSPLTLINRDNVGHLRALWRSAMGSGTSQGNAGQAQIRAYRGIYDANQIRDVAEHIVQQLGDKKNLLTGSLFLWLSGWVRCNSMTLRKFSYDRSSGYSDVDRLFIMVDKAS